MAQQPKQRTYVGGGKPEWCVVKECTDPESGLTVQVQMFPGFKPRYSLVVGRIVKEKGFVRYINPDVEIVNAVAQIPYVGMKLGRLYDAALLFIQEQVQAQLDQEILRKQAHEFKKMEREAQSGPKKQQGLSRFTEGSKTEREAAKRQKHEQNLSARRAADQERTRESKGK